MLNLDDDRWATLAGGYRTPVDLRPHLRALESATGPEAAWQALWEAVYHQGDVGEGSYAAVPHLVRIHRERGVIDWNTYAMVATIELARDADQNPGVPAWLRESYEAALADLGRLGLEELPRVDEEEAKRCILALLAVVHGVRMYGRLLLEFTEDEVLELVTVALGDEYEDDSVQGP